MRKSRGLSARAHSHCASTFASATAIASAIKWIPLVSMVLFILSDRKHQRKFDVIVAIANAIIAQCKEALKPIAAERLIFRILRT